MRQLVLNVRPAIENSFENFVVGDNAPLIAALHQHIHCFDGSVLYLWGASGSGRSHLLHAALSAAAPRAARLMQGKHWQGELLTERALLLIDDVDALDEVGQGDLFRLLIGARNEQSAFIVAGNVPARELAMREDVSSRLAQGLSFEIQMLGEEDIAQTLHQHAASRGMELSADIVNYLLRHQRRDLPWLMAVLDALDEASLSLGRAVTLPLLREILRENA